MPPDQIEKITTIKKTFADYHKNVIENFHDKHEKILKKAKKHALTVVSAAIVASAALGAHHIQMTEYAKQRQQQEKKNVEDFINQLSDLIKDKDKLSNDEESIIAATLSKKFNLNLKTALDGNRLNEIFGFVGAEQHLLRWSNDSLSQHGLQRSGMAPLQGAFRNFDNADQEKYYVAVQLHELPNWNEQWSTLKPWYKFRKVFVYNPVNQKGIVAVIGDSGPSKFTGKTFGGSPEIMGYLQMVDGSKKGKAIILFIDDPENKIALGPTGGNEAEKILVSK